MAQITNGIAKIEISPTGPGGSMGTDFQTLGNILLGSFTGTREDGTTTDFRSEQKNDPIFSRTTPGKLPLAFQIMDPDLDTFKEFFGGNIVGVSDGAIWYPPLGAYIKEVSVRITPDTGYKLNFPRLLLTPKENFTVGKDSLLMIDVTGDVLAPLDGITPSYFIGDLVGSSNGTPGVAQTITFGALPSKAVGDPPFALAATASSGLAVTYQSTNPAVITISGNMATIQGIGTADIVATQMGNMNFAPATPVIQTQTVTS